MYKLAGVMIMIGMTLAGCDREGNPSSQRQSALASSGVADVSLGKQLFEANCASCHGDSGRGTNSGPPLVNDIYRPGHHSDLSFQMAVKSGSRAHHWHFGDMPPIAGVSPEEVAHITAYIRQEQRSVGIR